MFLAASKIIPAIAAGNTVVAKAPSDDPIPLLMFARLLEEAGLPKGALNVVTGEELDHVAEQALPLESDVAGPGDAVP